MWPFKNKTLDLDELAPLDSDGGEWSVAVAETDEGPLIIRKNTGGKRWAKHPRLTIRLGFAIPLNQQNPGALPDPEENVQLDALEDMIVGQVAAVARGLHALTLTNGVMKEFTFYVNEGVDIAALHETVQKLSPEHEIQCMAEHDQEWSVYSQF